MNGVTVNVSAFSRKYSNGAWSASWLNFSSQGLGVTGTSEGNGSNNQYVTDSIGDSGDYILFEFSSPIMARQFFLNQIVAGSDITVWVGNKSNPLTNHNTLSDTFLSGLIAREDNNTTSSVSSRWAPINAAQNSGNILVIAANVNDPAHNDAFKVHKLSFCPGSSAPMPTPTASATPPPMPGSPIGLANVSTRLFVQGGDNVMIGGFIIAGDSPKDVILRGIGPSLTAMGVPGAMNDPAIWLYDSTGAVIGTNDNWQTDQRELIEDTGLATADDREAALISTLDPGAYTVVVKDETGTPGVALFDAFDLDPSSSQLVNLSTRGRVEIDDRAMIGGFILGGDQPTEVILRAIGPSLGQAGIADTLIDPNLELYDGQGSMLLRNDNWRSDQEDEIQASQLAPTDDRESAIIVTLNPGAYTGIIRGADNSTGIALFEIYKLSP